MNARAFRYTDFNIASAAAPARATKTPEAVAEVVLARVRGRARADGFADGVAQTEARIGRELEARLDAIAAALEDMRANRAADARRAAAEATAIVSVFLRAVAPRLADFNLAPEIVAALDAAFAAAPESRLLIEVAPDKVEQIAAAIGRRGADAEISASAGLRETEARIRWSDGFDLIDTGAAIERALTVLDAHIAAAPHQESEEPEQDR